MSDAELRYEAERRQGELIGAGHEDAWGWTGAAGTRRAARRGSMLVSAARLGPGVVCLELGSGTGTFTTLLADSGCELVAIELSEATAAIARERLGSVASIVVGNVETAEGIPARAYDAIVGVSVLHHLDVTLCLRNTFALLRPGGRFAFSEPNMRNPQVWAERHVAPVARRRHVTEHETAYTAAELRRLFESAGFLVETCVPFDFLHPATPARIVPAADRVAHALERTPLRAIAGSLFVAGRKP